MQNALDLGVPITGIAEATFARALSGSVPQREAAAAGAARPRRRSGRSRTPTAFVEDVRQALYASKIVAYSQGFDQIAAASDGVRLGHRPRGDGPDLARRLHHPGPVPEPDHRGVRARRRTWPLLLADEYFTDAVATALPAWRRVVAGAAQNGIPTPAFSSSLAYYDGIRAERLPAALIQGQRDFFGAHTYHRIDKRRHLPHRVDRRPDRVDAGCR